MVMRILDSDDNRIGLTLEMMVFASLFTITKAFMFRSNHRDLPKSCSYMSVKWLIDELSQ